MVGFWFAVDAICFKGSNWYKMASFFFPIYRMTLFTSFVCVCFLFESRIVYWRSHLLLMTLHLEHMGHYRICCLPIFFWLTNHVCVNIEQLQF